MNRLFYLFILLISLTFYNQSTYAQMGGHHGCGYLNPDSLEVVTVTGTAIVDTNTMMHPIYYIDTNGNGQADYFLNFGPFWYEPDSSNATRPNNGDVITIKGGLHENNMMNEPMIVVYEINGEFWRDPIDAFWNNMGHYSHAGGHNGSGCNGYSWGWTNDTLQTISLEGTALVDTTFMMEMFYLDVDNDGLPDYFLNFGPPWYEPTSGATRPNDGDQITIVGGKLEREILPMVLVYEINGLVWFDSTLIGGTLGGGWCQRYMTNPVQIHSVFNGGNWMKMYPGWHGGGMMNPNSIFCQMLELYPNNIPFAENENILAGYEIGIYNPQGQNMMWGQGGCGGMMNFNNNIDYQFQYNDIQLQGYNIDESTIHVKYWNQNNQNWVSINNAVLNTTNNTVSFSSDVASNYIILTGNQVTGVNPEGDLVVGGYTLMQNYPNPFNPATTIDFVVEESSTITLSIYNALGQKVTELLNGQMSAGSHSVNFNAVGLSSGTYFYELRVNGQSLVRKMNLLK